MNTGYAETVYTSLADVISEYEKDPEKRKLLDEARKRIKMQCEEHASIQPLSDVHIEHFIKRSEPDIKPPRYQLAEDIECARECTDDE